MPQVHPGPQLQFSQVQSGLSQPPLVMLSVMRTMLCVAPSSRRHLALPPAHRAADAGMPDTE